MGVKETIKTNIKRNLSRQYIQKLLGIISVKPILYAYGSTFSSVSDKYLNMFSIESLKKAYCTSKAVAFGSLFLPYEFFHSLDVVPFLPEVMAGFTAGLGLVDQTLGKASSGWYSQDLCTFHRSASGAVEMDIFPDPEFLLVTNLACDAAQKSFYIYSCHYGRERNYHLLDVPYEKSKESVGYVAKQLENIAGMMSSSLGRKIEPEKFRKSILLSNDFRKWAIEVNNLRKSLVDYPPNFNGLNFILPFHAFPGTAEAVTLYRQMHVEFAERLKDQQKTGKSSRPKRILWLHLKPYYKNEIFEILAEGNCQVVFEEINYVYWPELDPEKPFESLAEKVLSHPLVGPIENRIAAIRQMAQDYEIDGALLFLHWGCRQSNGGARIIKDALRKMGIPMLALDGDCVDQSNSQKGQVKTRLQGFIEILNSR